MKRQRGRGRKPGNNQNRTLESNGPDIKIRGNAVHIYEKYIQHARDATSSGDQVMAENYYQHAEHYLRIVQATQPKRDEQSQNEHANLANGEVPGSGEQPSAESALEDTASSEREPERNRNRRGRRRRDETDSSSAKSSGSSSNETASDPLAVVDPESGPAQNAEESDAPQRPRRPRRRRVDADAEAALQSTEQTSDPDVDTTDDAAA